MLGKQAEACFEIYLKHSKKYKLLVSNIQINSVHSTLGELDYIIRDINTQKILHIELACKFYLYDKNAGILEEEKWLGPNRKDRLYDKLEKVKTKQFPLLYAPETIQKLGHYNIHVPIWQQLCLKAFLFLPKKLNSSTFSENYRNCIVGYWIRLKDFEEEEQNYYYTIPTKKEWLLPPNSLKNWLSFAKVKQAIETQIQGRKSPLVYKKTPSKIERFFVVWW